MVRTALGCPKRPILQGLEDFFHRFHCRFGPEGTEASTPTGPAAVTSMPAIPVAQRPSSGPQGSGWVRKGFGDWWIIFTSHNSMKDDTQIGTGKRGRWRKGRYLAAVAMGDGSPRYLYGSIWWRLE